MKSTLIKLILILPILLLTFETVQANPNNRRFKKRSQNQQQRIQQGVKSGELTKGEAKHLEKDEKKIKHVEARAKADGVVTPEEAARIRNLQNKESQKIYGEKHDTESAPK